MITLRNGSKEPLGLVNATLKTLRTLMTKDLQGITALYDLYQICLSDNYRASARNIKYLVDRSLLEAADKRPHQSVKNIVLSAIEIEGEGILRLVNPIVE